MMTDSEIIVDCWNTVGSWGEELPRCPKLDDFGHCSNCTVYSGAGRRLLNRPAPEGYLEDWGHILSRVDLDDGSEISSLLIFSIKGIFFALPTHLLVKVTDFQVVHSLPHSRHDALMGITNIVGELMISVSLLTLFKIDSTSGLDRVGGYKRNVILKLPNGLWALAVDDVAGIHKVDLKKSSNLNGQLLSEYIDRTFLWGKHTVNFIDEIKLASTLEEVRF